MGRAPCCDKVGLKRGPWTSAEDRRLILHVQKYGEGNWRALPKQAGLLRCGKSCRLRWFNYLRPDIKKGNISKEEENIIMKLHALLGNRWSLIASKLPGRTDNEIKNHWNAHLKKRLIKMGIDPNTHHPLTNGYSIERNAKKEATSHTFQESNAKKAYGMGQKYLGPFLHQEIVDNDRLKMMEKSSKIKTISNDFNSISSHHAYDNIKCSTKNSNIRENAVNIIEAKSDPYPTNHELRPYGNNDNLDGSYYYKASRCNDRATDLDHNTPLEVVFNPVLQEDICTWNELQGDFHWDQLDLIHSLQAYEFITSRSPSCTMENNIECINLWNEENDN